MQDLKKYDFMYWFCFPALKLPSSVVEVSPPQTLSEYLSEGQEVGEVMEGGMKEFVRFSHPGFTGDKWKKVILNYVSRNKTCDTIK